MNMNNVPRMDMIYMNNMNMQMNSMNNYNCNYNILSNKTIMGSMMEPNMKQNNGLMNHLIGFNDINENNPNSKFIKLFFEGEFIQNVEIDKDDSCETIKRKIKSILFKAGKVEYRRPFPEEIIERTSPDETLEYLIDRGVLEENPSMIIHSMFNRLNLWGSDLERIKNEESIDIEYRGKIYGAGINTLEFVDVDKLTKTKNLFFSKNAPKWRKVSKGLNLFGKCINKKCEAYNEEVIYNSGINIKFDFNSDRKEIKCPICSKNFIPNTMGFWKCEYQIKGEKLKNGDYEQVNINGKETKGDNFEYYDPNKNDTTYWPNLMIFTGHRQKLKHRDFSI